MALNQIRQSSLVLGIGPGALTVLRDGSTALIPGTDAWYINQSVKPHRQIIPIEAQIYDNLLQQNLGVDFFVIPPAKGVSSEPYTDYLDVTLFPSWMVCYSCDTLMRVTGPFRIPCPNCKTPGKFTKPLVQTNFVIACDDGHLAEFPWIEWVHRGASNACPAPSLKFKANGVVELRNQYIKCEGCGKRRDLSQTNGAFDDGTTELSKELEKGQEYLCPGGMPWLKKEVTDCKKHVRMVLRSSNNIYFSSTVSSILVPSNSGVFSEAIDRVKSSKNQGKYKAWLLVNPAELVAGNLLMSESNYYAGISFEDLAAALVEVCGNKPSSQPPKDEEIVQFDRTPEWIALSSAKEDRDLVVRPVPGFQANEFGIGSVNAIPHLVKTTALKGFSRLKPKEMAPAHGKQLLRRDPFLPSSRWLPAIQQTGEGIFIALEQKKLDEWLALPTVVERAGRIISNLERNKRSLQEAEPSAKFFLLHTLAHVLIQELVIECGYTSASLAERIYSNEGQAGILIYTASASADGTMGGLVEMSHPSSLLNALENAIERARWCSNDPVCMEIGDSGHGNSGSNLAACHSCCLLPETACEHFNQGLDRAMLIGDTTNLTNLPGYFDFLDSKVGSAEF